MPSRRHLLLAAVLAAAGLNPPPSEMPELDLDLMRKVLPQRRGTDPVCHAEWSLLLCVPSAG